MLVVAPHEEVLVEMRHLLECPGAYRCVGAGVVPSDGKRPLEADGVPLSGREEAMRGSHGKDAVCDATLACVRRISGMYVEDTGLSQRNGMKWVVESWSETRRR